MTPDNRRQPNANADTRLPYSAPQTKVLGRVRDLTLGVLGSQAEAMPPGMKSM
jgi:hypothetical protein